MTPHILADDGLTVFIDGRALFAHVSHTNYERILDALRNDAPPEKLEELMDLPKAISQALATIGRVTVTESGVLVDDEPLNNHLTDRIMQFVTNGLPFKPLVRFYDKLLRNPSRTAVEELYLWLEQSRMPITETGNFLAYKKVNLDYTSIYDGKTRHDLHTVVEMPRNKVDDCRRNLCSYGLHFCSWYYLPHFGSARGDRVLILEIDPADVVSIPEDYDNAKGRACRYYIYGEVPEEKARHAFEDVYLAPSGWGEDDTDE